MRHLLIELLYKYINEIECICYKNDYVLRQLSNLFTGCVCWLDHGGVAHIAGIEQEKPC